MWVIWADLWTNLILSPRMQQREFYDTSKEHLHSVWDMKEERNIIQFRVTVTVISQEILMIFLETSAITWNTVKQNAVAISSCEAEYIAASAATCQCMWFIQFIEEILKIQVKPFKLYVDNKSAIALSKKSRPTQSQ